MKCKRLGLALVVFICSLYAAWAQDESISDLYNQIASMEYKSWGFTPKWYYYSWYRKSIRVAGIKISWDEPGLGIHDNGPAGIGGGDGYVKQRWRQMYPLRVTAAGESNIQAGYTDSERKFWEDINIKDAAVWLDRTVNLPFIGASAVTSDDRDEYGQQILDNIHKIRELGGEENEDIADWLRTEYDTIMEEVNILRDVHEANSNRLRSLQSCNNRLRKLSRRSNSIYSGRALLEERWVKNLEQVNKQWRRK